MTSTLTEDFNRAFAAVRGHVHRVTNWRDAAACVVEVCRGQQGATLAAAQLPDPLYEALHETCGDEIRMLRPPFSSDRLPDLIDSAAVGVTGCDFAIAQTGTLVEVSLNDATRLVSSLPRTHIGVVSERHLVATLQDAAPRLRTTFSQHDRNVVVSFLSGPSRTGDIELRLTLGVHGPEEAHALVLDAQLEWDIPYE